VSKVTSSISVGSTKYFLLGIALIIGGLVSFFFGIGDAVEAYSFDKNGLRITGTVIQHTTSRGSKGRTNHHALTRFKLPTGESYEQTFSENLRVGDTLPGLLLKNRSGHWRAKEASFEDLYLPGMLFGGFGLFFIGAGLTMGVKYAVRRKELDELNKFGKYVKAKISGITVKTTKNSSYSIVHALCEENLKGVGTSFVFDSEPISGEVSRSIVGSEVEILVNRQDASSYLFEVQ
jgi:hypothetical protein